ncbi:hypothetical protein NDU88_001228 [Pleurodeles waltl]|uniref:Uncharacterized protein n=1 Tax=Pleurodeles waltl TaxID=8319 RepID=A0AAV7TJJ4_PLEWA|nr:hypothetical protein NDU88_001228 [Pleurodeles waltl]
MRTGRGGRMREQETKKRTSPLCARCGLGVGATPKPKRDHAPRQKPSSILPKRATKGNKNRRVAQGRHRSVYRARSRSTLCKSEHRSP